MSGDVGSKILDSIDEKAAAAHDTVPLWLADRSDHIERISPRTWTKWRKWADSAARQTQRDQERATLQAQYAIDLDNYDRLVSEEFARSL